MQQMTNILLSSADAAGTVKKVSVNSKPELTVEGDHFSAALEKANQTDLVSKTEQKNKQNSSESISTSTHSQSDAIESLNGKAANTESSNTDDADISDDVSQVFAQINLANNFPNATESKLTIATDGETLPSVNDMAIGQEKIAIDAKPTKDNELDDANANTELSDEIFQALSIQSGVSEAALRNMPEKELKGLLEKSKILDSDGEIVAKYVTTSASIIVDPETLDAAKASAAATVVAESTPITTASESQTTAVTSAPFTVVSPDATRTQMVSDESTATTATTSTASAQLNGAASDPKLVNAIKTGNEQTDLNSKVEGRDILGKEAAIQAGTGQGIAQKTDVEKGGDTKSTMANANNMTAATEQLKGAELSVKLTATQMGLEAHLSSGNEDQSTGEVKTVSGLQAHNLQMQQGLTRTEPQQMQLSLKLHADQATQMQAMIQRFSPVMKQQLITMVSQGVQHAEIRLDPAELGSMLVRIQVQGDTTQVQFQVTQHQTRDLVEQAMPRLREMLAEQGMQLTDGQVSQGNSGNEQSFKGDRDNQGQTQRGMDEISAEELVVGTNLSTSAASGIDYYA